MRLLLIWMDLSVLPLPPPSLGPQLFNFDMEVHPMLEVLVGKTMEQSLLEVMEEEELASLRAQQRAFQELRTAELVEVQRLEEQERRHREEKVRRRRCGGGVGHTVGQCGNWLI